MTAALLSPPLDDFVEGCTWRGIPSLKRVDTPSGGVAGPPATVLTQVDMIWTKRNDAAQTFTLSSAGASPAVTITSAANWIFSIPKKTLTLATPGVWDWLIITTGTGADEKDPLLRGSVTVLSNL